MKRRTFVMSGLGPLALAACGGGDDPDTAVEFGTEDGAELDADPASADARQWDRRAVTFLEPVDGTETSGNAVNNRGTVVGFTGAGVDSNFGATLWTPGRPAVRLPMLSEPGSSTGLSINAAGRAVGQSNGNATLWLGGRAVDLGRFGGGQASSAAAINNAGQIVGSSYITPGNPAPVHAILWQRGVMVDLGTLGGASSHAADINNAGVVVGWGTADRATGRHAALWRGSTVIDLGVPGMQTSASAINDAGLVVGSSSLLGSQDSLNAVKWVDGSLAQLPTLGGDRAFASAVNGAGLIVGWSSLAGNQDGHAILWKGDVAIDLNIYLDEATRGAGWSLANAAGISDSGWVTGDAFNSITGARRGYRLSLRAHPR